MEVGFKYQDPAANKPIVFERILGEKPGGGIIPNPAFDLPEGIAMGFDDSGASPVLKPIKAYEVYEDAAADADAIKVVKGSNIVKNEYVGKGKFSAKVTGITTTDPEFDLLSVTLGTAVKKGDLLFQAKEASVEAVKRVAAGYYDAAAAGEGILEIVAEGATANQINLADVTPYHGVKILKAGDFVFKIESADAVEGVEGVDAMPVYAPVYLLGQDVPAGEGDKLVKLVNIAVVRKETVPVADEVLALMSGIKKV